MPLRSSSVRSCRQHIFSHYSFRLTRAAWSTVDDANSRYRIEEEPAQGPQHYWVVGGIYKDTHFTDPAELRPALEARGLL